MPPLPPAANVIKVNASWHCDLNTTAESIFHFSYTGGPPSAADCNALAAGLQAAFLGQFKTSINPSNAVGPWTVLDIGTNTGNEGSGGSTTAGTHTGTLLPASTAVVFNHTIARRYRGGKPRNYIPLGNQGDMNSSGTWLGTFVTAQNANWVSWITAALAVTSGTTVLQHFVNVSYYLNKALRATPEVDPITVSLARTRIGTQRRRNATA